ncbi:glycosyl transferase family 2 [Segniliparus rotundus DSM 44985]|uniref:Glycosyl transferase family 2 n=1 Tax=Segniliparus rotundus (strain ATCC BAA-972 / CDC 1076 / CIP 108378 / DSM 44985 / JCM 13578) TaxID=640132 RepID=D6ZA66_SEGRD|nr:glycosyltransferase family 2 protein [Segniliparus rotundus]ADG96608.1 glycosyl transferase family 2 [Segniliparus rotundus DSM 44985]
MTTQDDVWLVIPVYNEGSVITRVVGQALAVFPNIVCVDDGSRDDTAAQIGQTGAHLVRHPVNLGQGAAIQTGVEYARAQPGATYFVTFDADGQHRTEDAARMVARLRAADRGEGEPVDLVLGSRFLAEEARKGVPVVKRVLLRVVAAISPEGRRLKLTDAHNGLRAFNRVVAERLDILQNGMGHASEFVKLALHHHWRVVEEPVVILYTDYSKAKGQSLLNGVNILVDNALRPARGR